MSTQFKTLAQVKAANKAIGNYFFDRKSMRFFESKIESSLLKGEYFITSEKVGFRSYSRRFSIRQVLPDGSVKTFGNFNGFITKEQAKETLRIHCVNDKG